VTKIPLGISACLLGEAVRYDGGHKRNPFLTRVVGNYFEWVEVCPEVGAGLGVPRESMRLVADGDGVRLIGNRTEKNYTVPLEDYSDRAVGELAALELRGFVLKKGSPSCGLERVRIYDDNKALAGIGRGIFADRLTTALPHLPVEDEGRLQDPRIREHFITRIFTYDRWLVVKNRKPEPRDVVAFHTAHKMLLLAHSPKHYREMGPLVAQAGSLDMNDLVERYESLLMEAISFQATPGRHINVLEHLRGFLKNELSRDEREALGNLLDDYRLGRVPLVAPMVLLYHHLRHLRDEWVEAQYYLKPYPTELALRSVI